jgi:glutathione S-transferase
MSTTKVIYFDGYGRAEAIRILLTHAKVDFEDVRIGWADWATKKAELNLEFGQVPAVELDGKLYTQTSAIIRALGKLHGYYPEDPLTAWKVDSLCDSFDDLNTHIAKIVWGNLNEEDKKAALEKFIGT